MQSCNNKNGGTHAAVPPSFVLSYVLPVFVTCVRQQQCWFDSRPMSLHDSCSHNFLLPSYQGKAADSSQF